MSTDIWLGVSLRSYSMSYAGYGSKASDDFIMTAFTGFRMPGASSRSRGVDGWYTTWLWRCPSAPSRIVNLEESLWKLVTVAYGFLLEEEEVLRDKNLELGR
jgi:hypothetical protein